MKTVIIAGFDRCGSSMMCRMLSKHPDVSMMFQPFNSTEVHKELFTEWTPNSFHRATANFLEDLLSRKVDYSFIAAKWFSEYSQLVNFNTSKLNVIKETKCCMKLNWLKRQFPEITLYGIWRDPRGMLSSMYRNGFHTKWYGKKAFDLCLSNLTACNDMDSSLIYLVNMGYSIKNKPKYDDDLYRTAFILAASLYKLVRGIDSGNWLRYNDVITDPDKALNKFVTDFGLSAFDFSQFSGVNYNVSGGDGTKSPEWPEVFTREQIMHLNRIFMHIDHPLWEADLEAANG